MMSKINILNTAIHFQWLQEHVHHQGVLGAYGTPNKPLPSS